MTLTTLDPGTRAADVLQGLANAQAFIATHPGLPLGDEFSALHYEVSTGDAGRNIAEVDSVARMLGTVARAVHGRFVAQRVFGGGVSYTAACDLATVPSPRTPADDADPQGQVARFITKGEITGNYSTEGIAARVVASLHPERLAALLDEGDSKYLRHMCEHVKDSDDQTDAEAWHEAARYGHALDDIRQGAAA